MRSAFFARMHDDRARSSGPPSNIGRKALIGLMEDWIDGGHDQN